ncbi:MAG: glycosyltransferase family 4 protein [Candidatus Heimdallarchaeaceae archaeon]
MRILIVTTNPIDVVGGVENYIRNLVEVWSEEEHHIDILCTKEKIRKVQDEIYSRNIKLKIFPRIIFQNEIIISPSLIFYFKRIKNDYDQIHIHSMHSLIHLCLLFSPKKKTIFFSHFHPESGKATSSRRLIFKIYLFIFGKLLLSKSSKIVVNSESEKNYFIRRFKIEKDKVIFIPEGVSSNLCITSVYTEEPKNLLFIGRFEKQKGVLRVLEVFLKIKDEYENLKLTIVGRGKLKSYIDNYIKENSLEERVKVLTNIESSEIFRLYSQADLFLMPSNYESFGIAIAEAIASGVPTLATSQGGVTFYLENNKNGLLIDNVEDIEEIVEKTRYILNNLDLRNKFRKNGIKLQKYLSWEKTAHQVLSLL